MGLAERLRALMDERGFSGKALARKVPCDAAYVSRLINGKQRPSRNIARRLDEILGASGALAALAPVPHNESRAQQFHPLAEAVDLGAWLEQTNIGPGTLGYLASTAQRLANDYTRKPPLTVLNDAVEVQRRITALLRHGRQHLGQAHDLCRIAAETFALLTLLCSDVGEYAAADAYGHAGWICAKESGSDLASAFVLSAQAKTAQWEKRYMEAAARARLGYELCPPAGTRILLACQEANAAQAVGDFTRAREALSRARAAQDAIPDHGASTAWSCPLPREANYAAIVNLGCGDFARSLKEAGRADEAWSTGAPWVYGTWAQVRIGAAIAHVGDGEAEGAAQEIAPVLAIPSDYRVVTITDRLAYVNRLLQAPRYRDNHAAADLGDQIAEFCASSLRGKALAPGER